MRTPLPIVAARREERVRQGLTQEQLARRAYISAGAVGCYETGHTNPSVNVLTSLANALGCQLTLTPMPTTMPTSKEPTQ